MLPAIESTFEWQPDVSTLYFYSSRKYSYFFFVVFQLL